MFTHLVSAIKKFYQRDNGRVVFKNKMTLNQLALAMWERLDYKQIDSSVLSRVINGIRLFTPLQLKVFCSILKISKREKEYLHHCLYLDYCTRYGVKFDESFFSTDDAYDLLGSLIEEAERYLLKGKCDELERLSSLTQTHLEYLVNKTMSSSRRKKIYHLLGKSLYLKGRAIGSVGLPNKVIRETLPISDALLEVAKQGKNRKDFAFANILLANAYYVAGNYSRYKKGRYFYKKSINYAKEATKKLPDTNHEKLFAIRTIVASSSYLNDKQTFFAVKDKASKMLKSLPKRNFVNAIHLYDTIAKGEAIFGVANALKIKNQALDYFKRTLEGTHIYEVSDIRNELEIFSILKIRDDKYIKNKVCRALTVAKDEGYHRHIKNIKNLSKKLLN